MDLAASVQAVTEEVVLKLAHGVAQETGEKNLCLAGGVALNCVANGKLLRKKYFDRLWMQPAAGDAGGALGAALCRIIIHFRNRKERIAPGMDAMRGGYLGPQFTQSDIEKRLRGAGAVFEMLEDGALIERVRAGARRRQGARLVPGPHGVRPARARRTLDPRRRALAGDAEARSTSRSSTASRSGRSRPRCWREDAPKYFDIDGESPYMLLVADVAEQHRIAMTEEEKALFGIDKLNVPRSSIPAVTHVDYSARIQTVHKDTNPRYYALIERFKAMTGCPVIVNTSFNVRGEPIVCTPEDAFRCFMGTEIESLAVGNCFLRKEQQDPSLKQNYEHKFELD